MPPPRCGSSRRGTSPGCGVRRRRWMPSRPSIGADVPFFLDGAGAALVSGVGEVIEPLPPPIEPVGVLLLSPPMGASTAAVFERLGRRLGASGSARRRTRPRMPWSVEALAHLLRSGVDGDDAGRACRCASAMPTTCGPLAAPSRPVLGDRCGRPSSGALAGRSADRVGVDPLRSLSFARARAAADAPELRSEPFATRRCASIATRYDRAILSPIISRRDP